MAVYVIVQGDVHDPEQYERYKEAAGSSVADAGGKYLIRGGDVDALEGEPPGRTVVLEFPTKQAALDWYGSEQYAAARKLRDGVAELRLYVIEGA